MLRVHRSLALLIGLIALILPQPAHATPDDLLAQMTLEQKVAQMFVVSFYGTGLPDEMATLLAQWQPGSVILLPTNLEDPAQITQLTNAIQATLTEQGAPPALIAVNQEGGRIAALRYGFTQWPPPMLLTATQDSQLAYYVGQAIADEMRAVGINMNYAPVADLNTNPANPVIGDRAFGHDPQQVATILQGIIAGMQENGVLATAKHFPGHGDTASDSHLELPTVARSKTELSERELQPFRAAIAADVGAMMVAHVHYTAYEPDDVIPASLSSAIINDLLRGQLGYEGIIMTDALDMDAIDTVYTPEDASLRAVRAGHDLILPGPHISAQTQMRAMQTVVDTVRAGDISEDRIDASVRRILAAKARSGGLQWQALDPATAHERINVDAHQALIEQLFTSGIALIRDESALLPLPDDDVLFIFPGTRSSLWRACQRTGWQPMSITLSPSDDEIAAALQNAALAQTIVIITDDAVNQPQQTRLLRALPLERTLHVAADDPADVLLAQAATSLVTYSSQFAAHRPLCAILQGERTPQGQIVFALESR